MKHTSALPCVALVGNPNCGKSTLFNLLTHSRRAVGNRAGVTVDAAEGIVRGGRWGCCDFRLLDLPGLYALTPRAADEAVAREAITASRPDLILNLADATNLDRHLALTAELCALGAAQGIPVLLACNLADELAGEGRTLDPDSLADGLGLPAVALAAARGEGVKELLAAIARCLRERPLPPSSLPAPRRRTALARALTGQPPRLTRSDRIDRLLLNPAVGVPAFILCFAALFFTVFGSPGEALTSGFAAMLAPLRGGVSRLCTAAGIPPFWRTILLDGGVEGICSVLVFLPRLLLLFLGLGLIEDSGLMARAAVLAHPALSRVGLDGRAFVPLLLGFGCTVPAIMAARSLERRRDRALCAMLLPFISCSARAPVYAMIAAACFGKRSWMIPLALYGGGLAVFLLLARLLGTRQTAPLLVELPPYRRPSLPSLLRITRERTGEFIRRASGTLLAAALLVALSASLTPTLVPAAAPSESLLAAIGGLAAPLFAPLGFGNWRAAAALLSGICAKESILSTLAVLCPEGPAALFSPAAAASFLTFVSLYCPCVATCALLRREAGSRALLGKTILLSLVTAYLAAAAVYRLVQIIQF